jgi:hypothetical protein
MILVLNRVMCAALRMRYFPGIDTYINGRNICGLKNQSTLSCRIFIVYLVSRQTITSQDHDRYSVVENCSRVHEPHIPCMIYDERKAKR